MAKNSISLVLPDDDGKKLLGSTVQDFNAQAAKRAGVRVRRGAQLESPGNKERTLVLSSNVVVTPALFEQLPSDAGSYDLCQPGLSTPVGRLVNAQELTSQHATDIPLAIFELPEESCFSAESRADRFSTSFRLLRMTVKPTDGWVSRSINRPISRVLSYLLLKLRLKADHASGISLLIGLLCAWYAAQTGWATMVIAGILFQFASVFDGVDGEMARVTYNDSQNGARLDNFVDFTTYSLCVIGVLIGWIREGVGVYGQVLAVAIPLAAVLLYLVSDRVNKRYAPSASFVFLDRCLGRAAERDDIVALKVARFLFTMFRRDFYALAFMFLSFAGERVAIVALVGFGIATALSVWALFYERLVSAAQELSAHSKVA